MSIGEFGSDSAHPSGAATRVDESAWVRMVAADLCAEDAGADWLIEAGIDPTDNFTVDAFTADPIASRALSSAGAHPGSASFWAWLGSF